MLLIINRYVFCAQYIHVISVDLHILVLCDSAIHFKGRIPWHHMRNTSNFQYLILYRNDQK